MTTTVLSSYAGNTAWVTLLRTGTRYLACHSSDPTAAGLFATEVAGAGYDRQKITFSVPSGKGCASTRAVLFDSMPACVVSHLAVWDALSRGNLIVSLELAPPISVAESGSLIVPVGDYGAQF